MRQLMRLLPSEDIVYFGDTGRVPYGSRSPEIIEKYTRQDCRLLLGENVKLIIAACGTVSSVAPHVLRSLPIPATGVVEPASDAAVAATRNGRVGVIGTPATVRSGSFCRRIEQQRPGTQVFAKACPLFVPLVENGWIDPDDEVTRLTARRYLEPLREQNIDTLLLGCTHFPLLAPIIADILGPGVTLIDSGQAAAEACNRHLEQTGALADSHHTAKYRFYVSDCPDNFTHVAEMFLGRSVGDDILTLDIDDVDKEDTAHLSIHSV